MSAPGCGQPREKNPPKPDPAFWHKLGEDFKTIATDLRNGSPPECTNLGSSTLGAWWSCPEGSEGSGGEW